MKKILNQLNSQQLQVVTSKNKQLLIIAGAGTGKTKTITTKIAYLIKNKLAKPEEILALTFTEKAASEMEERVDILLPYGFTNTNISTFHAFGNQLLTEYAFELGINSDFKLLSEDDQAIFFNEHIDSFELKHFKPSSNPLKYAKSILKFFSRAKDELITPEILEKYATNELKKSKNKQEKINAEKYLELAKVFGQYQKLLIQNDLMDFGDQINLVIKLLKKPELAKQIQKKFKYILVDEFQDTNYAQNIMINSLITKHTHITVVGDDDQSIYKFRGASISNILNFTNTYPKTKIIVLNQNYRSTKQILDCAYKLIQYNNPDRLEIKHNINKKLKTKKTGSIPSLKVFEDHFSEAKFIATDIKESINDKTNYKDIAIITRSNANYSHIIETFKAEKIPYITSNTVSLYETPEVQICVNLIKAIANPNNSLAIFQLLTSGIYNIDPFELSKISGYAKYNNQSLITTIEKIDTYLDKINLNNKTIQVIKNALNDLKEFSKIARHQTTQEFIYNFLTKKKYLQVILKESQSQQNLVNLFKKIDEFEKVSIDKTIFNYINYLDEQLKVGATFDQFEHYEIDAVNILTAHSSKGLEFEKVYIPALTKDYFPSRRKSEPISIPSGLIKEQLPEKDSHLEEERRLFYVAMTRAKNELILSYAQNYGQIRLKKPSPFIFEALNLKIGDIHIIKSDFKDIVIKKNNQINLFDYQKQKFTKLKLNAHKIDDYLTCPLKYYYVNILKIPVESNHSVVYGNAIHKTIEYFLKYYRNHSQKPALKKLQSIFEKNWSSQGFYSPSHEKERYEQGKESIKIFYKNFDYKPPQIHDIEKPFNIKIEKDFTINGRIDVIYKINNEIILSDFKTSSIEDQKKADQRLKRSRQMLIYALAYQYEYNRLPEKLSLIFIDSKFSSQLKPTLKSIEKITRDINKVKQGIKNNQFNAKPNKHTCSYCAYKTICPKKAKGA